MRRSLGSFVLLTLLGLSSGRAVFHLELASSVPAENDTVRTELTAIEVTFSQGVEARYTSLRLLDARNADLPLNPIEPIGTDRKSFRARLNAPLSSGSYTVRWRTAGADGHVVQGAFDFRAEVAPSVAGPVLVASDTTSTRDTAAINARDREEIRDVNLSPIAVTTRWLNFGAMLLAVGGVAFPLIVLTRARRRVPEADAYWQTITRVSSRIALIAGIACLLLALPRLALQSAALHGGDRMWDAALLGTMLQETSWGRGWLLQVAGSVVFILGVLLARRDLDYWWFAAIALIGLAVALPLSGHAAGLEQTALPSILNDALHVIVASAWLGTLAYVLATLVIAMRSRDDSAQRGAAAIVRAFSPLALAGAGMALITGGISALTYLGPLSDLWNTSYGRALSLKLIAIMLAAGTGFYNWRTLTQSLGEVAGTQRLRVSATTELMVAAIVLLITAILVVLPTP